MILVSIIFGQGFLNKKNKIKCVVEVPVKSVKSTEIDLAKCLA